MNERPKAFTYQCWSGTALDDVVELAKSLGWDDATAWSQAEGAADPAQNNAGSLWEDMGIAFIESKGYTVSYQAERN